MAGGNKTTVNRTRCKVRLINFSDHIVEGFVFLAYGQRLSDLLNDERAFLPLETEEGEVKVVSKRSIMEVEILNVSTSGRTHQKDGDIVQLVSGSAYDILGVALDSDDAAIRLRYLELKDSVAPQKLEAISGNKELLRAAQQLKSRYEAAYDSIINARKIEAIAIAMRESQTKRRRFGDQ